MVLSMIRIEGREMCETMERIIEEVSDDGHTNELIEAGEGIGNGGEGFHATVFKEGKDGEIEERLN